jgi:hypothetical protein
MAVLVAIGVVLGNAVVVAVGVTGVVVMGTAVTVVVTGGVVVVTGAATGVLGTVNPDPPPVVPPLAGGEGVWIGVTVTGAGAVAVAARGVTIAVPTTLPSVAETWARFLGPSSVKRPAELIELFTPVTAQVNVWPAIVLEN